MSFTLGMSKFTNKTEKQLSQIVRKTALGLFSAVMKGTPVDSGRARGAWMFSINKFDNTTPIAIRSESEALSDIVSGVSSYKSGDTLTFSNNLDYIEVLEYGLFKWSDSAKVTNHYSSQAVGGFVRINVAIFQTYVNKAINNRSV